jgi:hypothetical protein
MPNIDMLDVLRLIIGWRDIGMGCSETFLTDFDRKSRDFVELVLSRLRLSTWVVADDGLGTDEEPLLCVEQTSSDCHDVPSSRCEKLLSRR